jgi:hypothetical protein
LSISCPSDWDTHLKTILYAYRVRAHEALEISPFELLYGVVPVDAQRDPLLSFGKALGFDHLLSLPDMHDEMITKDAHVRSLDPPVDIAEFFPGTLVLHKNSHRQDKLDVHWADKMYILLSRLSRIVRISLLTSKLEKCLRDVLMELILDVISIDLTTERCRVTSNEFFK